MDFNQVLEAKERRVLLEAEKRRRTNDSKELMKIANFWRPAIHPNYFDEFYNNMVDRFRYIKAVAINNNPNSDFYIGKRAKLKEGVEGNIDILKDVLITTVLSSGGNASFVDTPSRFKYE